MILFKNLILVLAIGIVSSCASKKTTDKAIEEKDKIEATNNSKKIMLEQGYSEGVIMAGKVEGDCPFFIEINDENYPYFLDPINLTEDFKADNQKIWFKFLASRMANRCKNANPISIIDMKKRVE